MQGQTLDHNIIYVWPAHTATFSISCASTQGLLKEESLMSLLAGMQAADSHTASFTSDLHVLSHQETEGVIAGSYDQHADLHLSVGS